MGSNNEYEHRGEWLDRLVRDMVKDRNDKNNSLEVELKITGGVLGINGFMFKDGVEISDKFTVLMVLRDYFNRAIDLYEKEFQRGFIPDGGTVYILPKEGDDFVEDEFVRDVVKRYKKD